MKMLPETHRVFIPRRGRRMSMSSRSILPISIVSKVQSQDTVKSISRCSHFLRSQKFFFYMLPEDET